MILGAVHRPPGICLSAEENLANCNIYLSHLYSIHHKTTTLFDTHTFVCQRECEFCNVVDHLVLVVGDCL